MVVRPMTARDSREVASLSNQLGYPSSASDIEKRLGTMTQGADFGAFVAEATDGRVVGWIHVYIVRLVEADAYAEIGGLVVDANSRCWRNKSNGTIRLYWVLGCELFL